MRAFSFVFPPNPSNIAVLTWRLHCRISFAVKYLGLLGLNRMMQKEPRVVSEYKDVVLQCLKDEDVSIRMRALDLLNGMVRNKMALCLSD